MELTGKTAIVTGGAVRIGRAISLALAAQGVNVCVHYGQSRREAEETVAAIRSLGVDAAAVSADLRDPTVAADAVVEMAVAEFGRADILINSAAVFTQGTLSTTTEEQWDHNFNVNLKAPAFLCQQFVAALRPEQRAHIINIADWRGTRPVVGHLAYTLTKSALVALTRMLAQELAPNVQVNAVAPGAILPPPGKDERHLQQLAQSLPLRRPGSPEEVTRAVLYLLDADFVTGEIIHLTGGQQL